MMNFEDLLTALDDAKIALSLDGEALVITAAKGALTDTIKSALREHKSTIVDSLRAGKRLSRVGGNSFEVTVPSNRISPDSSVLTPDMLPLIELGQADIDHILAQVPGGLANVQDIYSLAPLQEGILFLHRLAAQGDPYLQIGRVSLANRAVLDNYLAAMQQAVDRHDILRTAFFWEGLSTPAQVVLRHAPLSVTELALDPQHGPIVEQLTRRYDPSHYRIELSRPPLLQIHVAHDPLSDRWEMLMLLHHLIDDISSIQILINDIQAFLSGRGHTLPPAQPFRRLIAQVRLGKTAEQHEQFFRGMLADIDAPTAPFGLHNVQVDSSQIVEVRRKLPSSLNDRLRVQARRLGVSLGSVCHLAWGQVLARASGQQRVVFGTILFGRMHAGDGADQIMGPFINTLPLRLDLDDTGVEESVRLTHARLAELLSHEHASLSLAQRCSGIASPTPLFNTLLNYRHNRQPEDDGAKPATLDDIQWHGFEERTDYPLTLSVDDFGDTLSLSVQAVTELSPERLFGYMQQTLDSLIQALETTPRMPVRQLEVLPQAERSLLIQTWNDTDAAYPADRCIHQLFEAQVRRTPDATAVVFEDHSLSYAQLNAQANRLAHYLIEQGVQPDRHVAICMERSATMVASLLAILKAGGAYVPLDPAYPSERLGQTLGDAEPILLLTDHRGSAALGEQLLQQHRVLQLDQSSPDQDASSGASWAGYSALDPQADAMGPTPAHLAYVIYTSGSTGIPKGVMIEHRQFIPLISWHVRTFGLDVGSRSAAMAGVAFDASAWEIWPALSCGASLLLPPAATAGDVTGMLRWWSTQQLDTTFLTTPLANLALAERLVPASLRHLLIGGDRLQELPQGLPAQLTVVNNYGPTENAVVATSGALAANDELPHIGRPIANARIYLLDGSGRPVPLGAIGEIHIGGAGVARGYLNRPELTAERFVSDPFSPHPEARMYRSGDLARYLPDGKLVFLGRNDHQVKLRGYRIELGEIEARLLEHPAVREAAVLALDEGAQKRLVAYVVADELADPAAALREHLGTRLPDYMVPAAFVMLPALPLTPNGKLDRKALPAPEFVAAVYREPQTPQEIVLCQLFAEVLQVPQIGLDDHFFEFGGHSLLATRLISRIRSELSVEIPIRTLFEAPTVAGLAQHLSASQETRLPLQPMPRPELIPLSFAQQRLWFIYQLEGPSATYNIPLALELTGTLDVPALEAALHDVLVRHESLRTRFSEIDGVAFQHILAPEEAAVQLWREQVADPQALPAILQAAATYHFDLRGELPLRTTLLQLGPQRYVLMLLVHHIACDGASVSPLANDLAQAYSARKAGQPPAFAPLPVQYADYALWQQQLLGDESDPHSLIARQVAYWKDNLSGSPEQLNLPSDRPRPPVASYRGEYLPFTIDAGLHERLQVLSRQSQMTLSMVLQAALATLLTRLGAGEDIPLGCGIAGRTDQALTELVGFFVNTWVLRVDVSGNPSFRTVLSRVREQALNAYANQDAPFERLVELLNPVRSTAHHPLFQVMLVLQNNAFPSFDVPDLHGTLIPAPTHTAKFDLFFNLFENVDAAGQWQGIDGGIEYATDLFDRDSVATLAERFVRMLEAMVAHPERAISQVNLLGDAERQRLLVEWNATEAPYPAHRCVHQLFEEQVERTPDAVAVVHQEQSLSYRALNARANQIAHQLIAHGVRPGDFVALLLDRSISLVAAQLAVLKAGAVYVPLDAQAPGVRQLWVINDCAARVVLTEAPHKAPAGTETTVLMLDALPEDSAAIDDPALPLSSRDAAYVMYTSGSTGTPKGVVVPHYAINRLVINNGYASFDADDRMAFAANPAFDASTLEVWAPLLNGGALVVIDQQTLLTPASFVRTLQSSRVNRLWLTVGLFNQIASDLAPVLPQLKTLIVGGDALDPSIIDRVLRNSPPQQLINGYGPTESTTFATTYAIHEVMPGASIPIGRPIANTRTYLLDAHGQPVPLGATGELYIGGAGVAHGYLNRPDLTRERFLPDPFNPQPDARMYRTGDLARYRADGNLLFLGRNDHQIKLRGFRVELGEIETRLLEHPAVRETVVIVREDQPGQKQLVGYVVLNPDKTLERDQDRESGQVGEWQDIYESLYHEAPSLAFGENFSGWNSSYTGQPIPLEQMREWRSATVARIAALRPRHVLEIGVGSGLLLAHLAADCESYWASDFSPATIEALRRQIAERSDLAAKVHLRAQAADVVEGLPAGHFDTIVINSVVQYFPNAGYLTDVIGKAMELLAPGGSLFLGDLRNFDLLRSFASDVQLHQQSDSEVSASDLRRRIQQIIVTEKELLLAPAFFAALPQLIPAIAAVDIQIKRGHAANELSRYRYEVVLRKAPASTLSMASIATRSWSSCNDLQGLADYLRQERPACLRVSEVPNARLLREVEATLALQTSDDLAAMREQLQGTLERGVDPEQLCALGESLGYRALITWSAKSDGCLDAIFVDPAQTPADAVWTDVYAAPPVSAQNLASYANNPGNIDQLADLRRHIAQALPDYMVPAALVLLDAFPLTANGKLDRRALPSPNSDAFSRQNYEPPQGEIETTLAAIWTDVLGIDRVGRHDNFFELGGHSLLAIRLIERLRRQGMSLPVRTLFEAPTLSTLALALDQFHEVAVPPNAITAASTAITPAMLPLIDLSQADIDRIVAQTPGGLANIQDIYALAPLQEGILFHHLLATEGDPYLLMVQLAFDDRARLDRYLGAVLQVAARHDILRTAFVWEGISTPAQVVWREAPVPIEELSFDPRDGAVTQQLAEHFDPRRYRLDLTRAPLLRFAIAYDAEHQRWLLLQLMHHVIGDHSTVDVMNAEVQELLAGRQDTLAPPQPFRHLIAQVRFGVSAQEHERFFTQQLADIDEPTLPLGLTEVHRDGSAVAEARSVLPQGLNDRLRAQARRLGVSLASLCHLAWGQTLAQLSGQESVVFGTVLFGRMQAGEGADRAMGLFINTLPLRLDINATAAEAAAQQAHGRLAGLLAHEHASLALAQRCSGIAAGTPLFSAILNYRHSAPSPEEDTSLLEGVTFLSGEDRTNYPLVLNVDDLGDGLSFITQVIQPHSPERITAYMQQALESLVDALEHAPHTPVRQLSVLPADERELLLHGWNQTEAPFPAELCMHQLFEQQAERTPDAIALVAGQDSYSYRDLNARANHLAHQLIGHGVRPDQRIALCVERSAAMVVGLLAILKAGAAYVPLDPAYPAERLAQIVDDAAPALLLLDHAGREALDQGILDGVHAPILELGLVDDYDRASANPDAEALGLSSRHLAYVIYTSGSTGKPKGVQNEHRALINRLLWMQQAYGLDSSDAVLQKTSFSFDVSVWEFFWTLATGARLVMAPPEAHKDPLALAALIRDHRITTLHFVPSMLSVFLAAPGIEACTSLSRIVCSGEALSAASLRLCRERLPAAQVYNLYGPTEAAIDVTAWTVPADIDEHSLVSIGRPIANTRLYILDVQQQPVPLGAVGELYLGGVGIARGYLNRADLTAERFLRDPFSPHADARMYRTGDLARYLPDGNMIYLGRNDHQIKLRGFRIELGEIEARLLEHPAIREAVVVAPGQGSEQRLVAYVVPAVADAELAADLRNHLASRLPDYMVPAAFVMLEAFPLTPNGKLDRKALPAPDQDAFARQAYAAPQGEVEMALANIWQDLLGIEQVGRHDHFFELGGHSLLAVQLMERLRQRGLSMEIRALFATPTLSDLAAGLGSYQEIIVPPNAITPHSSAITPAMLPLIDLTQADIDRIVAQTPGGLANIQDIYALAPLQEGILFHHLLASEGDTYLQIGQMSFADRPMLDRFFAAIQRVVDRHDILRTAVLWEGLSTPAQVVWRQATLSVTELELDPQDGPIHEQMARRYDPRRYRIDITQAPLLRFFVAYDPVQDRWQLLQLLHHLIDDVSSLRVLYAEALAFLANPDAELPPAQPFRRLVAQARLGVSAQEHEQYFTQQLGDIDEPTLPFGLAEVHRDGSAVNEVHTVLPQPLNDRLRAQARRLGVSLASLCHLAWGQALAQLSGRDAVVFGTVLFGRMQAGEGADRAMGPFINTLPLRLDIDQSSVEDSVRRTHAQLADLLRHEHASLALAQRCSGIPAGTPLFSALLNYRHNSFGTSAEDDTPELQGLEWLGAEERTNYPLTLSVEEFGNALGLTPQVVAPYSPERIAAYMQQALESLVEALEHAPHTPVRQLSVLPADERELLLHGWNQTEAPFPAELCMHQLFEQQAERTPAAIALVADGRSYDYRELNAMANRLAHQLIDQGVRPDARIAICLERGTAMVVGLLAILKAGGAYVPLDPAYPVERLAQILDDAAPTLLLVDTAGLQALHGHAPGLAVLDLSHAGLYQDEQLPSNNPDPQALGLSSRHLAYVIYTSGSTGKPKGVQNEHRALINRLLWMQQAYGLDSSDAVLQKTSFSFDVSVWEFFWTLATGAQLVMAPPEAHKDPLALAALIREHRITTLHFVPSMLSVFLAAPGIEACSSLSRIVCSGEALSAASLRQCRERLPAAQVYNLYGPTEAAIDVTAWTVPADIDEHSLVSIGRPIANTRLYILDVQQQPVPLGAVGELYLGGVGVARGYLNRPELTAERFLRDPFSPHADARMYRTGDLARYLPDGNVLYLGRNDHQVKLRGFRIELGEIEARLLEHAEVREAVVLALGQGHSQRLVAYVVSAADADTLAVSLRSHLLSQLPEYMVPAAFVPLAAMPLTPNGKLDRKALPSPDGEAYVRRAYEAPQGTVEIALATIWQELLEVEQVGRHDQFFELGGHSLLAVQLMERLRQRGLSMEIRALFATPTLSDLAASLGSYHEVIVPPNAITPHSTAITPAMLPLIELSQDDIDRIVAQTPGGVANIQDIYALAPLQEGILFHHLLSNDGDTYLQIGQLAFDDRALLDRYLVAIQQVVDRHDILRTAFVWEGLSTPAQVVWRQAKLAVTELTLDPQDGPIQDQLAHRYDPRRYRIDISQAPLLHFFIAFDAEQQRWQLLQLLHHVIDDITSLSMLYAEAHALVADPAQVLPSAQAFRELVAQARLGADPQEHAHYFAEQFADIEQPTLPFGLAGVHHDGSAVGEARVMLPQALNDRLRQQARRLGVSMASLCHLAWGQTLAQLCGQETVVFGTILFGRLQVAERADRALGPFINTLPLRLDIDQAGVEDSVRHTHARLADLLRYEHASLALAQRHSSVPAGLPLFNALLNYRHNNFAASSQDNPGLDGIEWLRFEERTNYPLTLHVDDFGSGLGLISQVIKPYSPERIAAYMQQALESLADALEQAPQTPVRQLQVLPPDERALLLDSWSLSEAGDSAEPYAYEK